MVLTGKANACSPWTSCFKVRWIYSRSAIYCHLFIVFILFPHVFYFSYREIMDRFLISATFWGEALIRGKRLSQGGAYFDLSVNDAALIWGLALIRRNTVGNIAIFQNYSYYVLRYCKVVRIKVGPRFLLLFKD